MTKSAIAFSESSATPAAAQELSEQINVKMAGLIPTVIIVFASPAYDYNALLKSLKSSFSNTIIVGSSSAGEFTSQKNSSDSVNALAIFSDEIHFSATFATGIQHGREEVANQLVHSLSGLDNYSYRYHTALLFADALSGYTDELVEILTEKTTGMYQFFGGGAGDNANFKNTYVFHEETAAQDAAVMLEILSNKPLGIGIGHGWKPNGNRMKVTEADGLRLISLNATPAAEVFETFAKETSQNYDPASPIPFFLNNILGFEVNGNYKLRCPLAVLEDGSVLMASDIPVGASVHFMTSSNHAAKEAAVMATVSALDQLDNNAPSVALFFDCVATRLRLGNEFSFELERVQEVLKETNYIGCNTYGQVARVNGQFTGFQNCNAVVCIIPE